MAAAPCRIEIVDKENGWPVPLVELRSTHETRHVSDNLGLIAIDDPELLDREVWFHVKGHGYGVPKDGFGYEGVRTTLKAGGTFRIEVERRNIAKRLGRLTGAGLFAEGEKLGIAAAAARHRGLRLRFRANNPARRQTLLAVGRHHPARLPARRLPLQRRHHAACIRCKNSSRRWRCPSPISAMPKANPAASPRCPAKAPPGSPA